MIPKIIHYCWFGGNELPELAKKCIESWRKYLPDYEIKEWNESNFDISCCAYIDEAYKSKKWAFVSDYARFKILNENGGLYFDTDVEVIACLDDVIAQGPFLGCELETLTKKYGKETVAMINPGLGMAAECNMILIENIMDIYQKRHFIKEDGRQDITTIVVTTTDLFKEYGFRESKCESIQKVAGFNIYPSDYFCPMDYKTGKVTMTENTRAIHWYSSTWLTQGQQAVKRIIHFSSNFGFASYLLGRILSFPLRVWNKIHILGIKNTIKFSINKIKHI